MVDDLGNELAYIDALQERFVQIGVIPGKLARLASVYEKDQTQREEIGRMRQLLRGPVKAYEEAFSTVFAHTSDILWALKNFTAFVNAVRETRDNLHTQLLDWDPIIDRWRDLYVERRPEAEALQRDTYRFLASNYLDSVRLFQLVARFPTSDRPVHEGFPRSFEKEALFPSDLGSKVGSR